tara:strand:- start:112 stop:312 length:201 start_codon:yes stop_codon:yes gene_type:complete
VKIGDIVQWTPIYAEHKYMPQWMGIVLKTKMVDGKLRVKVKWFINDENYYEEDWTPSNQLKLISTS